MKTTFWKLLDSYKITIPIIQRDYAQGRKDKKTTVIRNELLNTIKNAVDKNLSVDFDFVYGTSNDGALYPLDGQQRLTTLFLLHWYFASKGQILDDFIVNKLNKFSYQTRASSQRFCEKLASFTLLNNDKISESIKDQSWFALTWNNDPTVVAMLNMLDDIQIYFYSDNVCDYIKWFETLTKQEIIHFQFLDMDSFNLSDDLYIKMNARGKPLTDFENFKARFEKYLDETGRRYDKIQFVEKVDGRWTDMFWKEMSSKMDIAFMRYFDFIAEIGFYTHSVNNEKLQDNDMELKFEVFKNDDILKLLFDSLDAWSEIEDKSVYFSNYFTGTKYEAEKVKLYENNVNLFERCLQAVNFDAKEKLMLYAIVLQLISKQEKRKELRLIRNLLINSPYEIRAENMHNLFCSIHEIMSGTIDYVELKKTFSGPQVDDEIIKSNFIQNNRHLTEELYHFEDHYILKGRMSAIKLDPETLKQYRETFTNLFHNDVDRNMISRAVLCFGDYSQGNGDRWKFANSNDSWHSIFTAEKANKIKDTLNQLLETMQSKDIEYIIDDKITELETIGNLSWEYYFIKYPEMNETMNVYGGTRSPNYVWISDFDICMLDTTRLSGYWRDPYLWTVFCQFTDAEEKDKIKDIWNIGGDKKPLNIFGIELSTSNVGWNVKLRLTDHTAQMKYDAICVKYQILDGILEVPKNVDRVKIAVDLINDIIK